MRLKRELLKQAWKEMRDTVRCICLLNKEAMLRIKLMNHQKRMIEFYIENAGTEYLTEEGNRWREKLNGRLTEIVRKNKEGNNEAQ